MAVTVSRWDMPGNLPCADGQSPRRRDLAVPAPARGEPGRLVPVGRGGARARPRRGQAAARLDRLLGLPLVPRDGARVLRERRDRRADERALRVREGRPRGAPGRRRDLHGRGAGDDRPRRLAAERVPDARRRAVLRRHLLPARAAPGDAELAAGARRASRRRGASSATRSTRSRASIVPRLRGAAALQAPEDELDPASLDAAVGDAAPRLRLRARRLRARRAEVPAPRRRSSSCCGAASARWPLHTLRAMASGGMYDQVGGGFARYSVDARWVVPHFEKMLYDNALLARAYLHGWQVSGEPLFRRVCEETLGFAARAAPGGGRLRLGAGRRLRGRRGQVLRVDAGRGARRAGGVGRRRDRALRDDRGRQLRGREHPRARDARSRGAARDQARLLRARASGACAPGSTTSA